MKNGGDHKVCRNRRSESFRYSFDPTHLLLDFIKTRALSEDDCASWLAITALHIAPASSHVISLLASPQRRRSSYCLFHPIASPFGVSRGGGNDRRKLKVIMCSDVMFWGDSYVPFNPPHTSLRLIILFFRKFGPHFWSPYWGTPYNIRPLD